MNGTTCAESCCFKRPPHICAGMRIDARTLYGTSFVRRRRSGKRRSLESSLKFPSTCSLTFCGGSLQKPGDPHPLPADEARAASRKKLCPPGCLGASTKRLNLRRAPLPKLTRSNLLKLSQMADRGEINNRWGNDAATGLTDAIRKGAVLVTTNPIMVNAIRKEDSGRLGQGQG